MNKRILAIGRNNGFLSRSISELSEHGNIDAVILVKSECVVVPPNVNNLKTISILNILGVIRFYFFMYKNRYNYDAFIFYYLQEYFYGLLILNIIKRPKFYFPFGSDLHTAGIKRFLLKIALKKFKKIFIEIETQKQYIIDNYKVLKERVESSIIIFNVDSCFRLIGEKQKEKLREKWEVVNKFVVVSPRTLSAHYNHDLVIMGLGCLDEKYKNNVQLIIIGTNDFDYIQNLKELGRSLNVEILHVNKYITPQEMSEIFNISDININIPNNDQFGHSIIEGSLCGSIPMLSNKIENYREVMEEGINCIYTNLDKRDIAMKMEHTILNYNIIKKRVFENNLRTLYSYTKNRENTKKLISHIHDCIL